MLYNCQHNEYDYTIKIKFRTKMQVYVKIGT